MSDTRHNFAAIKEAIDSNLKKTGLEGANIYHGTTANHVESVVAGPLNIGSGFGGKGVYVSASEQCAHEFADHAYDRFGSYETKSDRVIMRGSLGTNKDLKVASITIARRGQEGNIQSGIFPADWHQDKSLHEFIKNNYDILEVKGLIAAGYNSNLDKFHVFHERGGKDAISWTKAKRVSQFKPGSKATGVYNDVKSFFRTSAPSINPQSIVKGQNIPVKGKVLFKTKLKHFGQHAALPAAHALFHIYMHYDETKENAIITATKDFAVEWTKVYSAESIIGLFAGRANGPLMIAGEVADSLPEYHKDENAFEEMLAHRQLLIELHDNGQMPLQGFLPGSITSRLDKILLENLAKPFSEFVQPYLRQFGMRRIEKNITFANERLKKYPDKEDFDYAREAIEEEYKNKSQGWFQSEADYKFEKDVKISRLARRRQWDRLDKEEAQAKQAQEQQAREAEAVARERRAQFNFNTGNYDREPGQSDRVTGNPGTIFEAPSNPASTSPSANQYPIGSPENNSSVQDAPEMTPSRSHTSSSGQPNTDSHSGSGSDDNAPGDNPGPVPAPQIPEPQPEQGAQSEEQKPDTEKPDDGEQNPDDKDVAKEEEKLKLNVYELAGKFLHEINKIMQVNKQFRRQERAIAKQGDKVINRVQEAMYFNREGILSPAFNIKSVDFNDPVAMRLLVDNLLSEMSSCQNIIRESQELEPRVRKVLNKTISGMKKTIKRLNKSSFTDFDGMMELNMMMAGKMLPGGEPIAQVAVSLFNTLGILGTHRRHKQRQIKRRGKRIEHGSQILEQGVSLLNFSASTRLNAFYQFQGNMMLAIDNYTLTPEEQLAVIQDYEDAIKYSVKEIETSKIKNNEKIQKVKEDMIQYAKDHAKRFVYEEVTENGRKVKRPKLDKNGFPILSNKAKEEHNQKLSDVQLTVETAILYDKELTKSKKSYEDESKEVDNHRDFVKKHKGILAAHHQWMTGDKGYENLTDLKSKIRDYNKQLLEIDDKIKSNKDEIRKIDDELKKSENAQSRKKLKNRKEKLRKESEELKSIKNTVNESKDAVVMEKDILKKEKEEIESFNQMFHKHSSQAEENLQKNFYEIDISLAITSGTATALQDLLSALSKQENISDELRRVCDDLLIKAGNAQAAAQALNYVVDIAKNFLRYKHKSNAYDSNWTRAIKEIIKVGDNLVSGEIPNWDAFKDLLTSMTFGNSAEIGFSKFLSTVVSPTVGMFIGVIHLAACGVRMTTKQLPSNELHAIQQLGKMLDARLTSLENTSIFLTDMVFTGFDKIDTKLSQILSELKHVKSTTSQIDENTRVLISNDERRFVTDIIRKKEAVNEIIYDLRNKVNSILTQISTSKSGIDTQIIISNLNITLQTIIDYCNMSFDHKYKLDSVEVGEARAYLSPEDFFQEYSLDLDIYQNGLYSDNESNTGLPNIRVLTEEIIVLYSLFNALMTNRASPMIIMNGLKPDLLIHLISVFKEYTDRYLALINTLHDLTKTEVGENSLISRLIRKYRKSQLKIFENIDEKYNDRIESSKEFEKHARELRRRDYQQFALKCIEANNKKSIVAMSGSQKFLISDCVRAYHYDETIINKFGKVAALSVGGVLYGGGVGSLITAVSLGLIAFVPPAAPAVAALQSSAFVGQAAFVVGGFFGSSFFATVSYKKEFSLSSAIQNSPFIKVTSSDKVMIFDHEYKLSELRPIIDLGDNDRREFEAIQEIHKQYDNELYNIYNQYSSALEAAYKINSGTMIYSDIQIGATTLKNAILVRAKQDTLGDLFLPNDLVDALTCYVLSKRNHINLFRHTNLDVRYDLIDNSSVYNLSLLFIDNDKVIFEFPVASFTAESVNGFKRSNIKNQVLSFDFDNKMEFLLLALYGSTYKYMGMPSEKSVILEEFPEYTFMDEIPFAGLYSILDKLSEISLTVVEEEPRFDRDSHLNDLTLYIENDNNYKLYQGSKLIPKSKALTDFLLKERKDELSLFEHTNACRDAVLSFIKTREVVYPVISHFRFDHKIYSTSARESINQYLQSSKRQIIQPFISINVDGKHVDRYITAYTYEPEYSVLSDMTDNAFDTIKRELFKDEFNKQSYKDISSAYNELCCTLHNVFGAKATQLFLKELNVLSPYQFRQMLESKPEMTFLDFEKLMPNASVFDDNDAYIELVRKLENSRECIEQAPSDYFLVKEGVVDTFMDEHPEFIRSTFTRFSLFSVQVESWLAQAEQKDNSFRK